jgi:hypothetical protein
LRNYYAIHDLERYRLGLVPHRYSLARVIPNSIMNMSAPEETEMMNKANILASLYPRVTDPLKTMLVKILIALLLTIVFLLIPASVLTFSKVYLEQEIRTARKKA